MLCIPNNAWESVGATRRTVRALDGHLDIDLARSTAVRQLQVRRAGPRAALGRDAADGLVGEDVATEAAGSPDHAAPVG
eukprot:1273016-Pyramimonas_sp.AAC.1